MSLLRTKTVNADHSNGSQLRQVLSALDLTLLGIGAGIFVLTGIAAATQAGPAVALSFVLAGLACAFAALAYAELAAAVGGCGSAYGYAYAGLGEIVAWIIGWDLILEYGVATAAVSIGWSGVAHGAAMVFFAYIGFDAVSTAAEEARNPQRDLPIGIIASPAVCTAIQILVSHCAPGSCPTQPSTLPHRWPTHYCGWATSGPRPWWPPGPSPG